MACNPDEQNRLIVIAEEELGNSGQQRSLTRHVHSLLGFGRCAADDHIFDIFQFDSGRARHQLLDTLAATSSGRVSFSEPRRRLAYGGA